jgi:hypothetical protein
MAKADSVLSTPPTNTSAIDHPMMFPPVDPTRRRFLAVAAVASAVSAGTLAAAALALDVPQAVTVPNHGRPDPVYAAIEAHRTARAASCAATAEIKRLCDLADEIAGPRKIDIPSMIEPGTTVRASIWLDIEEAIPSAQFPEQYAHYFTLLEESRAAHFAVTGDTDPIGKEEYEAEWDALGEFADTVPTTLAGLLAMIIYAAECQEHDLDAFTDRDCPLIENLATAAKAMIGGQS